MTPRRHTLGKKCLVLVLLLFTTNCFALGYFSRACKLRDIPDNIYPAAAILFTLLGAPSEVVGMSYTDRDLRWVLESITTDYLSARYCLWVSSAVYQAPYGSQTSLVAVRQSPWSSDARNDQMLTDSRLQIFFANRTILFSARGGAAKIVEQEWVEIPAVHNGLYQQTGYYNVRGAHYYYDPVNPRIVYLGTSSSTDCNLSQWGFENR